MIPGLDSLVRFFETHSKITVLSGAGISTGSGIPGYRDGEGRWTRVAPVYIRDFLSREDARRSYWARSLLGWPRFRNALCNAGHFALAALEGSGHVRLLITQNVDRLHQQAGSGEVIDLHGRLDRVVCLSCGADLPREQLQRRLIAQNRPFADLVAEPAPDGDARLDGIDLSGFSVPGCPECGGLLKPDVVFFGETVPKPRSEAALEGLLASDALLVCGSSLMVYSGYRFCRKAAEAGIPIAAVNMGRTRADDLIGLKLEARCELVLPRLAEWLCGSR